MREQFHEKLRALGAQLADMCSMAATELRLATKALLEEDLTAAAEVLAADERLDQSRDRCEQAALELLALQAPVAKDLRMVLSAVYCADRIERMGDLARHIAELVRREQPGPAVPPSLVPVYTELGRLAGAMAEDLRGLIEDSSGPGVAALRKTDDQVDELHEQLMEQVTGPDWTYGVRHAVNVAHLARYYERFADQAVSVARRVDFVRTGVPHGQRIPNLAAAQGK
ncbi:phosphate transport system protein [Amycolatopsis marina]|uniref:Phosphate-specific transport system accessory protein PhoU n=1 Tax=Amycolatopsis marina TaxID=490629 RepID=A0A1I0X3A8_9PSEU|nr:phosphate signaling complex protein PhoU [Amycolatopsis marina]SFA94563.1 phosphate transport system protein [Amycolatopsis marina]